MRLPTRVVMIMGLAGIGLNAAVTIYEHKAGIPNSLSFKRAAVELWNSSLR